MNSRERVLCALNHGIPDAVPYMYGSMDGEIIDKLLGRESPLPKINGQNSWGYIGRLGEPATVEPVITGAPELTGLLKVDAIGIQAVPPLFAETDTRGGRIVVKEGLLTTRKALNSVILPDPDDEKILRNVENLVERCRGDHALYARVRLGAAPTLLSMGLTGFSYSLCDEPELVHDVLRTYCEWSGRFSRNLSELDFDFFWCFDDIAFKSAPMFSRDVLREFFLPNLKLASSGIKKPWIFHSDGNLLPILDDLLELGMNGTHPLEPGTMDLDYLKAAYGKKLCLIGNVDIDKILTKGTPADVDREVRERIRQLGPGGGYIISDSNSVPNFCRPENIVEMAHAVERYRYIY